MARVPKSDDTPAIRCKVCDGGLFGRTVHHLLVYEGISRVTSATLENHLRSTGKTQEEIKPLILWVYAVRRLYGNCQGYLMAHLSAHEKAIADAEQKGPCWRDTVNYEREIVERIRTFLEQ